MTTFTQQAPIVGAHFRPPAKDVLANLPGGAELILRRQPDNPHDPNAVQVLLPGFSENGAHGKLFQQIRDSYPEGSDNFANATDPLPLGYVANSERTGGKFADDLCEAMSQITEDEIQGPQEVRGTLTFGTTAAPQVLVTFETGAQRVTPLSEAVPGVGPREDVVTPGYTPTAAPPGMDQGEFARELIVAPDKASKADPAKLDDYSGDGSAIQRHFQASSGGGAAQAPTPPAGPVPRQGLRSTDVPAGRPPVQQTRTGQTSTSKPSPAPTTGQRVGASNPAGTGVLPQTGTAATQPVVTPTPAVPATPGPAGDKPVQG